VVAGDHRAEQTGGGVRDLDDGRARPFQATTTVVWPRSPGFVVVQPTHLDSRTVGLFHEDPRVPRIWRFRVEDDKRVLDQLDLLEAAVPGLGGRLDRSRIAAAGHSFGGQTAGNLLGLRVLDSKTGMGEGLSAPRVKAGVSCWRRPDSAELI
jgi:predicted dienelactone hydrolase